MSIDIFDHDTFSQQLDDLLSPSEEVEMGESIHPEVPSAAAVPDASVSTSESNLNDGKKSNITKSKQSMTKQTVKSHTKKAVKSIEHQEKGLSLHIKLQGKARTHFMMLKSLLGLNSNELITQLIEYGIEKHREELMECLK